MSGSRRAVVCSVACLMLFGPLILGPEAAGKKLKRNQRSRVGVVVVHNNGDVETECVKFEGSKMKGLDILNRTSFDIYTEWFDGFGRAVCLIDGEGGDPSTGCFTGGPPFNFWQYWIQNKKQKEPRFSSKGAFIKNRRGGSVDYWVFDDDSTNVPDAMTVGEVCNG